MQINNKEKAKEIARINQEYYESGSIRCISSEKECYDSAMEMAEWKDDQAAAAYCKCCNECDDHGLDICKKLEDFMTIMKEGEN